MMELQVIDKRNILNYEVTTYGDLENPLFLAKDVANWIGHSNHRAMINMVDEDEKVKAIIPVSNNYGVQNESTWFLTEDGLYEVLMQSRKPIAKDFKKKVKKLLKDLRLGLDPYKNMSKELQAIFMIDRKTVEMDTRLSKLENTMTIDYSQQEELRMTANRTVVEMLDGKGSQAYKKLKNRVFQDLWRSYKRQFRVNSYKNTAVKDYEKAVNYIENWQPDEVIAYAISGLNNQASFA